jgi:hypothetical protein
MDAFSAWLPTHAFLSPSHKARLPARPPTRLPFLHPPADKVKLGGASAGSLLAACIKSGMPLDSLVEQNMKLMHDLRQGGTRGRLGVRWGVLRCVPACLPALPACSCMQGIAAVSLSAPSLSS